MTALRGTQPCVQAPRGAKSDPRAVRPTRGHQGLFRASVEYAGRANLDSLWRFVRVWGALRPACIMRSIIPRAKLCIHDPSPIHRGGIAGGRTQRLLGDRARANPDCDAEAHQHNHAITDHNTQPHTARLPDGAGQRDKTRA